MFPCRQHVKPQCFHVIVLSTLLSDALAYEGPGEWWVVSPWELVILSPARPLKIFCWRHPSASCQRVMAYQLPLWLVVSLGAGWCLTMGNDKRSFLKRMYYTLPNSSYFTSSVFEINVSGWRIKRVACMNCKPELIEHSMVTHWLDFKAPFADDSSKCLWRSIICRGRDCIVYWLHLCTESWCCLTI